VPHSPILVPKFERPFIHFSLGNSGAYIKTVENAEGVKTTSEGILGGDQID